jgi:hypothetical protein
MSIIKGVISLIKNILLQFDFSEVVFLLPLLLFRLYDLVGL